MRAVQVAGIALSCPLGAGLLFTGIDLDTIADMTRAALGDFDALLARDSVVKGPPGHGPQRSDLAILRLAALTIFHPSNLPSSDGLR